MARLAADSTTGPLCRQEPTVQASSARAGRRVEDVGLVRVLARCDDGQRAEAAPSDRRRSHVVTEEIASGDEWPGREQRRVGEHERARDDAVVEALAAVPGGRDAIARRRRPTLRLELQVE